jgi:hypothetical protein
MDVKKNLEYLEHAEITVIKKIVRAIIKLANLRTYFKVHPQN